MDRLQQRIDQQLESNKGKNLFHVDADKSLSFLPGVIEELAVLEQLSKGREKTLVEYATHKVLQEFYRVNQYFHFDAIEVSQLKCIYAALLRGIRQESATPEDLSQAHYRNLRTWLAQTHPFSISLYAPAGKTLQPVACAQYSAALQLEILAMDPCHIEGPVLDIGCGSKGTLVRHLQALGLEAVGFDRLVTDTAPFLQNGDWLEFDYGTKRWGTIISNLGFSNHFHHHHLRQDGNFLVYARKYRDILHALKVGGRFHYGPALPFVEQFLDNSLFRVEEKRLAQYGVSSSIVTRLA